MGFLKIVGLKWAGSFQKWRIIMMEKQNENQLGNRIAELRKEAGLTQEQLAGKLGVTYQAVSKWENGDSLR